MFSFLGLNLDSMHHFENFAFLASDFKAHPIADFRKVGGYCIEFPSALGAVGYHHHVEVILDNRLGYVEDIDIALQEIGGDSRDDSDHVLADNCYYDFFHCLILYTILPKKSNKKTQGSAMKPTLGVLLLA